MILFTLKEILDLTGGIRIGCTISENTDLMSVSSVSTDTRTLLPGALFAALTGEHFDGHTFCQAACQKGAALFLVSDGNSLPDLASGILVSDTLLALHALARGYRKKLGCKVIAVTGSVGKTSTREMLAAALSRSMRTYSTKHNLNNEIGLPMTILSAPADTELLIVEMGMRMRKEISVLSLIAQPDIAIITNVGVSHIERLGSQEEILLAKMEICDGLSGDRILLINGDDSFLSSFSKKAKTKRWNTLGAAYLIGTADMVSFADISLGASSIQTAGRSTEFTAMYCVNADHSTVSLGEFKLPCVGMHHVRNALLAILCAQVLSVPPEDVKSGLASFKPAGSRGRLIRTGRYLIYDDAYNASPESMAAAFESVRLLAEGKRKIAAIGCVLELGSHAAEQHFCIGADAAKSGMDILFVCGDNRGDIKSGVMSVNPMIPVFLFSSREELTDALLCSLSAGDIILVKASHAFDMGKVTQAVIESENVFSKPFSGGKEND